MLRRMVERILVDREERKVRCYLRRLPIIANITDNIDTYFLDQGLSGVALGAPHRSPSKHGAEFHGAACSPNGILVHPENSCIVIDLELDQRRYVEESHNP